MGARGPAALAMAVVIAGVGSSTNVHAAQIAPLYEIPTESQAAEAFAADIPARVRLITSNPQGLAQALGVKVPSDAESFEYVIDKYAQLRGAESRTWLEPTFVIDFDEPAFEPLRKELAAFGGKPTRAQLVEFVARILDETHDRGWDLASIVARRREGDCTEHAVLTAALARMQGIPARIAVGVALVSEDKNHNAYGHAWAEFLEDGQWKVADAALHDGKAAVRYLPMGVLDNEGMGYTMNLALLMKNWVDRVVVLGPAM
jgi:transglutaminase-like putative cysteine protease